MATGTAQGTVASYIPVGLDMRPAEAQANAFFNKARSLNINANLPLGTFGKNAADFEKSLAAAEHRVLAFTSTAAVFFTVKDALEGIVTSTVAVEKALAEVNVVLNLSQEKFEALSSGLFQIGNNTGKSFDEAAKASVEFSRQGLGLEETLKRTNDALILNRLSGLGVVESTQAITTTINSFTKELLNSTTVVSKFAAVDQAFAVSSGDLAEAVSRVGSSAQEAGVNLDQLIGIVTAAQQTTGRGGAVIGEAFKTIFTRISSTKTISDLRDLGVEINSTQDGMEKLAAIAKAVKLNPELRNQIEELAGGKYRINILTAAVNDLSNANGVYAQSSNTASRATDEAIKRNEKLNNTLAALFNTTKNSLVQTAANIGDKALKPIFQRDAGNLNSLLDSFNDSQKSENTGFSIGRSILDGIASFVSGPGIAGVALIISKLFIKFGEFTKNALGGFLQLNEAANKGADVQAKYSSLFNNQVKAIDLISQSSQKRLDIEKETLAVLQAQDRVLGSSTKPTLNSFKGPGVAATSTSQPSSAVGLSNLLPIIPVLSTLAQNAANQNGNSSGAPNLSNISANNKKTLDFGIGSGTFNNNQQNQTTLGNVVDAIKGLKPVVNPSANTFQQSNQGVNQGGNPFNISEKGPLFSFGAAQGGSFASQENLDEFIKRANSNISEKPNFGLNNIGLTIKDELNKVISPSTNAVGSLNNNTVALGNLIKNLSQQRPSIGAVFSNEEKNKLNAIEFGSVKPGNQSQPSETASTISLSAPTIQALNAQLTGQIADVVSKTFKSVPIPEHLQSSFSPNFNPSNIVPPIFTANAVKPGQTVVNTTTINNIAELPQELHELNNTLSKGNFSQNSNTQNQSTTVGNQVGAISAAIKPALFDFNRVAGAFSTPSTGVANIQDTVSSSVKRYGPAPLNISDLKLNPGPASSAILQDSINRQLNEVFQTVFKGVGRGTPAYANKVYDLTKNILDTISENSLAAHKDANLKFASDRIQQIKKEAEAIGAFSFDKNQPNVNTQPVGFSPKQGSSFNFQRVVNGLSNFSFAAPFVAGGIQEAIGSETRGSRLAGSLVSGAGSALGSFGLGTFATGSPIGGAAFAAGSVALELQKIKGQFFDQAKQFQDEIDKIGQSINQVSDSFSQYIHLTDQLNQIYSGNINANISQIIELERKKKKLVEDVEKELNVDFSKLSPEDQQAKINEFKNRQSSKIDLLETDKSISQFNKKDQTIGEKLRENLGFLGDLFKETVTGSAGQKAASIFSTVTPLVGAGVNVKDAIQFGNVNKSRFPELFDDNKDFTKEAKPKAEAIIQGILAERSPESNKTVEDVISENKDIRDAIISSAYDSKKSIETLVKAIQTALPGKLGETQANQARALFNRDPQQAQAFAQLIPSVVLDRLEARKQDVARATREQEAAPRVKELGKNLTSDIATIERQKNLEIEVSKLNSSRNVRSQEIGDTGRTLESQRRELFNDKFDENLERFVDTIAKINARLETETSNLGNTFQSEVANSLRNVAETLKKKAADLLNDNTGKVSNTVKETFVKDQTGIADAFLKVANQPKPFTTIEVSQQVGELQALINAAQDKIDNSKPSSVEKDLLSNEINAYRKAIIELEKATANFNSGVINGRENAEKDKQIATLLVKSNDTLEAAKGALNVFGNRTGEGAKEFDARERLRVATGSKDTEGIDAALRDLKSILSGAGLSASKESDLIEKNASKQTGKALPVSAVKLPDLSDLTKELKAQDGLYASIEDREKTLTLLNEQRVKFQDQINLKASDALQIEKENELVKRKQLALDAQQAFNANRIGVEDLKRFNAAKREQEIKTTGTLTDDSVNQAFEEEFIPLNKNDKAKLKEAQAKFVSRNTGQRENVGNQLFDARQNLNIAEKTNDQEGQKSSLSTIRDLFESQKLEVPSDIQSKLKALTKLDQGKDLEEFPVLLGRVRDQLKDQGQLFSNLKEKEDLILEIETKRSVLQGKIKLGIVDGIQAQKEYNALVSKALASQAEVAFGKNQISGDELRSQKAAARLDEKRATGKLSNQSISDSFFDEFKYNGRDFYDDLEKGASSTAKAIKSEFSSAFKSFADGSKSAGQAFTDFLSNIGKKFADFAFDIALNSIFSSIFGGIGKGLGKSAGGQIGKFNDGGDIKPQYYANGGSVKKADPFMNYGPAKRFSTGGSVLGGSGVKDDVPAVLTAGEYVVKKASAQKYGEDVLNAINDGRATFDGKNTVIIADKDGSSINAGFKNTYNLDNPTRPTKGVIDYDPNLSSAALDDENNPQNQIRFNRERDLGDYLRTVREFNKRKKQAATGALIQAGISVAGLTVAKYVGALGGVGATSIASGATGNTITSSPYQAGVSYSNNSIGGGSTISSSSINSAPSAFSTAGLDYTKSASYLNTYYSGGNYGGTFTYGSPIGRAMGGPIQYFAKGGSALKNDSTDNVRTMLTGGEYVFGHYSTKKYPKQMYDKINSGNARIVRKAESGGSVTNSQSSVVSNSPYSSANSFDKLNDTIVKLDNTINSFNNKSTDTSQSNGQNVTIQVTNSFTTNIASNGESKTQSSSAFTSGNNKNNDRKSQDSSEEVKQLNAKLETTVRKVIIEESRIGGIVWNIIKKG